MAYQLVNHSTAYFSLAVRTARGLRGRGVRQKLEGHMISHLRTRHPQAAGTKRYTSAHTQFYTKRFRRPEGTITRFLGTQVGTGDSHQSPGYVNCLYKYKTGDVKNLNFLVLFHRNFSS